MAAINSSTFQAQPDSSQRRYFRIQEEQQISQAQIPIQRHVQNHVRPQREIYQQNIILQERNAEDNFNSLQASKKYKGSIKIFCITSIIQDWIFFILFLSFYIISTYYDLFLVMMIVFLVQITICIYLLVAKKDTVDRDIMKKEYQRAKMIIYFVIALSLGSSIACIALQYQKDKNTRQQIVVNIFIIIGLIYITPKLIALCIISCRETPDDMLPAQQN